jgi:hypothetical protein
LWKSEDAPTDPAEPEKGGGTMPATVEDLQADLEKMEKERDEALTKAQEAEAKADELEKQAGGGKAKPAPAVEDDPDDLEKADLPEAVRVRLQKADEEIAELRKAADSATEMAKAERDARVKAEFIELAKSELPELGDPEVVGMRLMKFSETLEKAEYDEYLREQTAINEQLSKSAVFGEVGRGGQPPRSSAGLPEILSKAEELQKADSSLSSAEAMRRAAKDPAIQAAYARERDAA